MSTAEKSAVPARRCWPQRRFASLVIRIAVLMVPVLAGAAAAVALSRAVARPDGFAQIAWWAMILAGAALTVALVDRAARTLLPLAALLRLTLIFPDKAPSRLSVALRTMNGRRLQALAREANDDGTSIDVVERATRVLGLAAALNVHDRRTRGHSERVCALTALVAEQMGLDEEATSRLLWGALLHDIGKLSIPKEILNKPGAPDEHEWRLLARHPVEGERIAGDLRDWLGVELAAIGQHHEKWDGSGYPIGLAGEEIAPAARIVAVTDAFETMTALRSYKLPASVAAARSELVACSGTHFEPAVVRAFLNISIGRLHWSVGVASWLAQLPFVGVAPRAGAQLTKLAGGWAASETAVAGVAALVVTALFAGVGSPTAPADAAVHVTARGPKPVVLDASDGTGAPPGGAGTPGGGLGSAGAGTPGGGLGSAGAGTPGGGAVPPSPHGSPTPQPQSPPPPAAPSGGGGRPFEIPPGHTSPKPPGPSNADGDPGREVQPTPTWVPGKGNPGGK